MNLAIAEEQKHQAYLTEAIDPSTTALLADVLYDPEFKATSATSRLTSTAGTSTP